MKRQEIVEMLKHPVKPDLEGLRAALKGYKGPSLFKHGEKVSRIKHWLVARSFTSAQSIITKKAHPERAARKRQAFVRSYGCAKNGQWSSKQSAAVIEAMKTAGIREWQKVLPKSSEFKSIDPEYFTRGFYVNLSLNRGNDTDENALYGMEFSWRWRTPTTTWGSAQDAGISAKFLQLLEEGNAAAELLAKYGFQDSLTVCGDTVCFIRLPEFAYLEEVRDQMRLHRTDGFASRSGRTQRYMVRGVQFLSLDQYFDPSGKLKVGVKDVLKEENTERRRVLVEMFTPEEMLAGCDAKRVDGPTALGNELFRVDVGLPSTYRMGRKELGEKPEWGPHENPAYMLRYTCPSTDRVYVKFVDPASATSADAAQAWSHHFTLADYKKIKAQS